LIRSALSELGDAFFKSALIVLAGAAGLFVVMWLLLGGPWT
jgi:hypothetical protein